MQYIETGQYDVIMINKYLEIAAVTALARLVA